MSPLASSTSQALSPMESVLGTTELLENILLHLPIRTLLLSQRVQRCWRDVIIQSPCLQEKLFFKAQSPKSKKTGKAALGIATLEKAEMNPLLEGLFPPLLNLDAHGSRNSFPSTGTFKEMQWNLDESARSAVLRECATWRKMFPCQSPPLVLEVNSGTCTMGRDSRRVGSLADNDLIKAGVRMGLIYDVIERGLQGITSFFIRWHQAPLQMPDLTNHLGTDPYGVGDENIDVEKFGKAYGGNGLSSKVTTFFWRTQSCVMHAAVPPSTPKSEGCQEIKIIYGDHQRLGGYEGSFYKS